MNAPDAAAISDFVVRESRLLDEQRFDEWLDLFTADGRYWMPLEWGQTDPLLHNSLFWDDKILLKIRIERLKGHKTYSQKPRSRCHHVLQATVIDRNDPQANRFETWTPFHYVEARGDEQNLYAGWSRHTLVLEEGNLRIRQKRVDLVNPEAAFGNIQLFM